MSGQRDQFPQKDQPAGLGCAHQWQPLSGARYQLIRFTPTDPHEMAQKEWLKHREVRVRSESHSKGQSGSEPAASAPAS